MSKSMDELVAAARLGGQIDAMIGLKEWADQRIKAAEAEYEKQRKEIYEHDNRTASAATN